MPGVKGRSGRRPLPTAVKALRGTLQPCRTNPDEPKPVLGRPECPADFDKTQRARWERVCDQLEAENRLAVIEEGTIAAYVIACVRVARANRHVNAEGAVIDVEKTRTYTDGSSETTYSKMRNPWATELQQAKLVMKQLAVELGVTSSSRTRVRAAPPEPKVETERDRLRREFGGAGAA